MDNTMYLIRKMVSRFAYFFDPSIPDLFSIHSVI